MLHSYYLKAFRHHGQKAVKQLCEKEINEEINGAIMYVIDYQYCIIGDKYI